MKEKAPKLLSNTMRFIANLLILICFLVPFLGFAVTSQAKEPATGFVAQLAMVCSKVLEPFTYNPASFFATLRGLPKHRSDNLKRHHIYSKYFLPVCDIDMYVQNQTLRFDVDIYPLYRGRGLYQKLLERVLKIFPEVQSIPAEMNFGSSDNARAFLLNLFNTKKLKDAVKSLDQEFDNSRKIKWADAETVIAWRNRMIEAYYQTPAGKARERVGFGHLTKLTLAQDVGCIEFETVKGDRLPPNETKIFITPKINSVVELMPTGKVMYSTLEATDVGPDYIRTWEPCHKRGYIQEAQ